VHFTAIGPEGIPIAAEKCLGPAVKEPLQRETMKKTYLVNDIVWMAIASLACIGGLKLGFGSLKQPQAGFMPFMSGLLLGGLALLDLISGLIVQWREEKSDKEIWAGINWSKVLITIVVLFLYTVLLPTLGFVIGTTVLLIFLFRVMEPKAWWVVFASSLITTALFYVIFKIGLDSQLPRGFLGF
jgi:hypothetical protein